MDGKMLLEMVGYLGSGLVIVSMLMTSVVRLRVINCIGSGIFTVYALLIHSYPTALMNLFLVGINVFYLIRMRSQTRTYDFLKLGSIDEFTTYFLTYYQEDMEKHFPDFLRDLSQEPQQTEGYVVFCEQVPAGILIGRRCRSREGSAPGDTLQVILDYTTPAYRDFSVGSFLYDQLPDAGIRRLVCPPGSPAHQDYLSKMGFTAAEDRQYEKRLP